MGVKVQIPTPLRRSTGGAAEVVLEAAPTVGALLDTLEARHAGIKERIIDEKGEIRRFVNIYVNGDDVRFAEGLTTAVKDGDEVSIVPAIAGGRDRPVDGRAGACDRMSRHAPRARRAGQDVRRGGR